MSKDKVVKFDTVSAKEIKKALCTITVSTVGYGDRVFTDAAGYQLLEGNLVILIHEGATYIVPLKDVVEICIEANKE
jgi:hypothetical protein